MQLIKRITRMHITRLPKWSPVQVIVLSINIEMAASQANRSSGHSGSRRLIDTVEYDTHIPVPEPPEGRAQEAARIPLDRRANSRNYPKVSENWSYDFSIFLETQWANDGDKNDFSRFNIQILIGD